VVNYVHLICITEINVVELTLMQHYKNCPCSYLEVELYAQVSVQLKAGIQAI
jgi:hypothetical protein